jgi:hypothetical protein
MVLMINDLSFAYVSPRIDRPVPCCAHTTFDVIVGLPTTAPNLPAISRDVVRLIHAAWQRIDPG